MESPALAAPDRYFRGVLAVTVLLTGLWVALILGGWGSEALRGRSFGLETVGRVGVGFLVMRVLWGWLWYGIKRLLLRRLASFSREEVDGAFRSRMGGEPFDLQGQEINVSCHFENQL